MKFPGSVATLLFLITLSGLPAGASSRYMIEVGDATTSSVTKESFQKHFYGVFFQNLLRMRQQPLPVIPAADWEKPYFTAYTVENDNVITIGFWGGMARIPGMNDEAVALITCHEVGHVIGGEPRFKLPLYKILSSEGQADYYATAVCLKEYFAKDPDTLKTLGELHDPRIRALCEKTYEDPLQKAICLRSLRGAQGMLEVLLYMKPEEGPVSFDQMAQHKTGETLYDQYPTNQCRLDTLIAGALGAERPGCWYKRP